jgi:hypothetical protein
VVGHGGAVVTSNPLGELDFELDEIAGAAAAGRWRTYRRWVFAWVVLCVLFMLVLVMTTVLVLADEPYEAGVAVLVVLVLAWVSVSAAGWRARERWQTADQLAHGG